MKGFIALLVVFVLLVGSFVRNSTWADPISLNADTLKKSPFKARPHYGAAIRFYEKGELDKTFYHLKLAENLLKPTEAVPRKGDIYAFYGNVAKYKGYFEDALWFYTQALHYDPFSSHALSAITVILADMGRIDEAKHYLQRLSERYPAKFLSKMSSGYFYLAIEMPGEAVRYLSEAIELNPDSPDAYIKRAKAYQMLNKAEEAGEDLKRAKGLYLKLISEVPNNIGARKSLAIGLAELGDTKDAEVHFRYLLGANNDDPEIHNNLGSLLAIEGRVEEALNHFQRAIEIRPSAIEPYLNMADALESLGRYEEAKSYRAAVEKKNK